MCILYLKTKASTMLDAARYSLKTYQFCPWIGDKHVLEQSEMLQFKN